MCLIPNAPCPATTIFMEKLLSLGGHFRTAALPRERLVLEDDVTESRIRSRHVIEAIHLAHLCIERAARDQPHDELDGLGTRLAHVLDERNTGKRDWIRDEIVEEACVELAVDEPRAL